MIPPWEIRIYVDAMEQFRYITYPGILPLKYAIGTNGTILHLLENFVIAQRKNGAGYLQSHLTTLDGHTMKDYMIHRLVAWEWLPETRNITCDVNHRNGIKTDNYFTNLEWISHYDNVKHAFNNGLVGNCKGENHRHKLTEEEVRKICELLQDPNKSFDSIIKDLNLDVSRLTISSIANGHNWTHITCEYNIPPRAYRGRVV